jgi:alkylation response protein AidB-like acyl-CoA dehydrogenase
MIRWAGLGQENQGFYQIMQCFEHERLVIAAGRVGAAEACLDETQRIVTSAWTASAAVPPK